MYYRNLGELGSAPYIVLDGDSLVPGSETVRVLAGKNRYVLLCAYGALENGTGSFLRYRARVVVDDGAGSRVTVPLYLDGRIEMSAGVVEFKDFDLDDLDDLDDADQAPAQPSAGKSKGTFFKGKKKS